MRGGGYGWVMALGLAVACGKSARNGDDSSPGGRGGDGGAAGESGEAPSQGGEPPLVGEAGASLGGQGTAGAVSGASGGGAGGEAGAGGEGGAEPPGPTPLCDDGNDCTVDAFVAGACENRAAPDGAPCSDGSTCTLGDRCAAGLCVAGALQTSAGQVLGRLDAYGTGLIFGAGEGRFAFVDAAVTPGQLTLASVEDGELRARARAEVHRDVGYRFIGAAWDDLLVVADGMNSAILNGPTRYLQLFTMETGGSLTAHAPAAITPGSQTIPVNTSFVGRGSSLFLCHNFSFLGSPSGTLMWWDVADPDAPTVVAQGSTNGQCGSVAVSEDGQRVYVNTVNGVLWSDLSTYTSGDLTFAGPLLPDSGLHVRGDRLLSRSGDLLRVFSEPDRTELASFSVPGAHAAALTEHGIFVERDVAGGMGTESSVALYTLQGDLVAERATQRLDYTKDIGFSRAIVSGNYGLDGVTKRVFALSPTSLSELEAPELGALTWPFMGAEALHVRGLVSAHRVDVSDPAVPRILTGGPSREAASGIELALLGGRAELVPETDATYLFFDGYDPARPAVDPRFGHTQSARVRVVQADENEHTQLVGAFELPGGAAQLQSAGDAIYRAAYRTTGGVRLQRFQIADLRAGIAKPAWDLGFDAPAGTASSVMVRFDVDPRARRALLSTSWADGMAVVTKQYFVDVAAGTSSPGDALSAPVLDLKLRGDSWVYVRRTPTYSRELVLRSRHDLSERVFQAPSFVRLLAFDGVTAYYATYEGLRAVRSAEPPLLTLDLATRGVPIALAETPTSLVATLPGSLVTFAPPCE